MSIVRIERKRNDLYPLPADYLELSPEGQRLARVNACRQWQLSGDPNDRAHALAACINFFDRYYLYPDWDEEFNPYFYDDDPIESPLGHFAIYRLWALASKSVAIAPRGFAKSNCFRKSALLQMVSRPAYSFIYATSSIDNAEQTSQVLKTQFLGNQRLFDDWGPEFPDGRITPKRGERSFGVEMMYLNNGSWFRAISAESRQRGGRPRVYALDDPEYDPKASTSMSILRSYMERLLFKVVMPMVTRRDTSVRWLATFVSRRHYAWHAMMTEPSPTGLVAKDPRFDQWARLTLKAEYEEEGVRKSCWPGMWPLDRKAKDADPKLKGFVSLEEIREMIGTHNYLAEYLAQPGEAEDMHFGEVTKEKHGWWLESPDPLFDTDPKNSESVICWNGKGGLEEKMPIQQFLKERVRMFITVDTSFTATSDSDFKVCTLLGYDPVDACLFVLDTWGAQCREQKLIEQSFAMAGRWGCPTIHPEVVRQSFGLYTAMESMVRQKAAEVTGQTPPRIIPLKVGMLDKTSKINSLHYRFEHGLIKFPTWRRGNLPWRLLFDQIEQFNPDADSGGLQHDDFIDTVAMSMFVVRGRLDRQVAGGESQALDFDKMLTDGTIHDALPGGIPVVEAMDFSRMSAQSLIDGMEPPPNVKRGSRV